MANDSLREWRSWIAPSIVSAVILVLVGWLFISIGDRIGAIETREGTVAADIRDVGAKVDRRAEAVESRVSETNSRIDRILEGQTAAAEQVARLQSDVTYVRDRVDQIAERLEASAPPTDASPAMVRFYDAIDTLRDAGMEVYDIRQLQGVTVPAVQRGIGDGDLLVLTPNEAIHQQLRDMGIEPISPAELEANEPVQTNDDAPDQQFSPMHQPQ